MYVIFYVCVQRKHFVRGGCRLFVVASLAKAALKAFVQATKFGATLTVISRVPGVTETCLPRAFWPPRRMVLRETESCM